MKFLLFLTVLSISSLTSCSETEFIERTDIKPSIITINLTTPHGNLKELRSSPRTEVINNLIKILVTEVCQELQKEKDFLEQQ
ncbi:MAG: hypothetical protein UR26_C0002G0216 [candidate division TM6 bacterium GW2011_GWF2_32_72]|nr:MAG: hypothetical protein UR26_C0002G0216 [candidate division TM6 bacterium GW2011_GWF2_32_72]